MGLGNHLLWGSQAPSECAFPILLFFGGVETGALTYCFNEVLLLQLTATNTCVNYKLIFRLCFRCAGNQSSIFDELSMQDADALGQVDDGVDITGTELLKVVSLTTCIITEIHYFRKEGNKVFVVLLLLQLTTVPSLLSLLMLNC